MVVDIDTAIEFHRLETFCQSRVVPPPVEILARKWWNRFWLLIGRAIISDRTGRFPPLRDDIVNYIKLADLRPDGEQALLTPNDINHLLAEYLLAHNKRCVITIDNIERYVLSATQTTVIGGLVAATRRLIGRRHRVLDVKLCLPAEVFDRIKSSITRPDKDLHKIQFMHWSSFELFHVAATRLSPDNSREMTIE